MKVSQILTCLVASHAISAASIPESNIALSTLEERRVVPASEIVSPDHTLERRKGGGGRGGGGGGGGRSGGSSGRSSSSSGASARTFGGGRYYAGGAQKPYSAGKATPGGIRPGLLIAPAALFLIMPGIWLYSVYPYHYNNNYRFYNETARDDDDDDDNDNNNNRRAAIWERQTQGRNESLPVVCLCQEFNPCGCEENEENSDYIDELVGNGNYTELNKTLVTVSDVNGTKTLVLNGTLPNGTDTEAAAPSLRAGNYVGYYAMAMLVVAGVML
ncbi:hypothetical protein DDE82_005119 [Stemphylium lycopersici]|uniref:DUF7732 domain-containing protein n=1 Tax=Stemphylium lycopersici TaxID=183478 RepID=A0A364MY22_STELY|nr:hypothetical protein TW65_04397 [Stemphylium lycopersici]RAR03455.1 hypothetical protein DDE82_005119 [Stemphylium lycopersici]RAR06241.1 hypothetical protein DDE83_007046 [Stemphylium lycopersici]